MTTAEVIQGDKSKTIDDLLDEWDLTVRTYNVLKREGVTTLDRLTFLTEDQLWEMRNFGARSVEEIITKLHEHGYKLAGYTAWRTIYIPGLKEGYQASRDGIIRSPGGRELKPAAKNKGTRLYISTVVHGRYTVTPLDVMVLSAYHGFQEGHEPVHLDEDQANCRLENLAWSEQPEPKKKIRGRAKKCPNTRVTRKEALPVLQARDTVEVYRTYVNDEVLAAISDDGSGSISVGGTTLSLTAYQLRSLTLVAARIAEMNALMGIG